MRDRHLVAGGERVSKKGQGPRSPSFRWEGHGEGKYTATMVPVSPGGQRFSSRGDSIQETPLSPSCSQTDPYNTDMIVLFPHVKRLFGFLLPSG